MNELIHKLGIDWRLLIANAVTFLIVVWILKRYAFKPILRVLDERRRLAEKTVTDQKEAEAVRHSADEQHTEIVREARQQAGEIMVHARADADGLIEREKHAAQKMSQQIQTQAAAEARRERERIMAAARAELANVVVEAAGRLVNEKAAKDFDAQAVDQILKQVKQS